MTAATATTAAPLIRLHANDNVLIARQPIALGQELPEFGLRMRAQVPAGHKIAARRIAAGEPVKKYDTVIGVAARDIEAGEHVHSHNLDAGRLRPRPGLLRGRASGRLRAGSRARDLHGHRAARRPRGDAQLHRHPVVGQLLGDGDQEDRRALHARAAGGLSRTSTAWSPSRRPAAAACRRRASTSTCCAARSPATRATRTWPAC